ncbi:MAG TPA: PP2C family protein-serine/threonine phosphatase [Chloroflexota bacterium]|nr:PP2C family protein-serine/threonine phosphatase [Chloroflexota bacterium]
MVKRDLTARLASLCRIGQVINSSLVLDEVLNLVIDNLLAVTGAERGSIMLLDEHGNLVVRAARNLDRRTITADDFQTSRRIVREVALHGVPRLINDASTEQAYQAYASVVIHSLRSILCVPLKVREQLRGVLYVDNRLVGGAFTEEDLVLLSAFADQAAVAIENARLYAELAQRERLRRELEIARSIQMTLMPRQLPTVPGFALAAACVPARDVGGDFYDALRLADGRLALFLGDVSGKGVPAALLMGVVRTLLRAEVQRGAALAAAVRHCNRVLYDDFTNTNMFATLFLGLLDPARRTLTYLNCGHCEPLLWRRATGAVEALAGDALPLGILEECEGGARDVALYPGDVVLIYSDGFTEAKSAAGEYFGLARLQQALCASAHLPAEHILDDIGAAVDRFVQNEPQSDDQTIVVLQATAEAAQRAAGAPERRTRASRGAGQAGG